jgi:hypothetical protein
MTLLEKITNNQLVEPNLYKLCTGCDSILTKEANICPICHQYKLEEDPLKVLEGIMVVYQRRLDGTTTIPEYDDEIIFEVDEEPEQEERL